MMTTEEDPKAREARSRAERASNRVSRRSRGPLALAVVVLLGGALYAMLQFAADAAPAAPGGAVVVEGEILPDREDYYAVSVVDPEHAWIVGSYGTVLALSERGRKVELRAAPVRQPLFCASFRDAATGVAGGRGGIVLRTTDGGRSWSQATLPGVSENILAMARGADPRRIWAVGPRGTLLRSINDGETWEDHSLGTDITLNAITMVNDNEGWVVGEFGTILHTLDAGSTWQRSEAIEGLPPYVEDVTEEEALRMGIPPLRNDDLYLFGVVFPTPDSGYIVAAGGFVLETSDRGGHWTAKQAGTRNTLFEIASVPGGGVLSAGVLGTIVHRREGRWVHDEEISHRLFTWIRAIGFSADGAFGVAVGGKATVLFSRDRGETWDALPREQLALLRKP